MVPCPQAILKFRCPNSSDYRASQGLCQILSTRENVPLLFEHLIVAINRLRKQVRKSLAKSKKEELSFNDFLVAKVINGRDGLISHEMAKHWAPYYKICSPCTMGLDFIVRLDPTMEETKVN